jgi:hypothetical protein
VPISTAPSRRSPSPPIRASDRHPLLADGTTPVVNGAGRSRQRRRRTARSSSRLPPTSTARVTIPLHDHRQRRRQQRAGQRGDHGCRRQRSANGDGLDLVRQRRHRHRCRARRHGHRRHHRDGHRHQPATGKRRRALSADGTTPVVAGTPITAAQAASLIFTPAANFNGTVTIPFTVTDDDGGTSAPANEVITVVDVNDLPTATASRRPVTKTPISRSRSAARTSTARSQRSL